MESLKVRAHHGMCLAFFIGKGYSSSFVENMFTQKEMLESNNPIVELVCQTDCICKNCPNNENETCVSLDKVELYDKKVLKYCGIQEHTQMHWKEFFSSVNENIFNKNLRKEICADCVWNELCEEIGKKLTF